MSSSAAAAFTDPSDQALLGVNAFTAIGRGRVEFPRYPFTVRRTPQGFELAAITFRCTLVDLYDFNYDDSPLAARAAALQLGYGRGNVGSGRNTHGKIYRSRIEILRHDEPLWTL